MFVGIIIPGRGTLSAAFYLLSSHRNFYEQWQRVKELTTTTTTMIRNDNNYMCTYTYICLYGAMHVNVGNYNVSNGEDVAYDDDEEKTNANAIMKFRPKHDLVVRMTRKILCLERCIKYGGKSKDQIFIKKKIK